MLDRLVVMNGEQANREHHLNFSNGPVLFGRSSAQANIAIPDPQVSRVHFQIENRDGQIWVIDQGSSSGTLVNGRKIMEQQLKAGDILRAGETQLRFVPSGQQALSATGSQEERLEELAGTLFAHYQV